jgi:MFS family permease
MAVESGDPYPRRGAAWYALIVLTLCYTFSYVDRQILAFLVDPLKQEFSVSDTQIGLLQGIAFAIFYSFFGMPMGRLADRYSRRNIILIGLIVWSAMTALSSAARNFVMLVVARMGVGVGEAVINPCAFSLIADYFPKERLSSALSVYMMGIQAGAGLSLVIGGVAVQALMHTHVDLGFGPITPWRLTFLAVGLPGILFALLLLTVKEPPRRGAQRKEAGAPPGLPLFDALREVAKRWQSALGIAFMIACQALSNYALLSWSPTFFDRVYHWPRAQSGLVLGFIVLFAGCGGMFMGGRIADRWQRAGITDATLRTGLVSLIGVGLTLPTAMLMPSATATVAMIAVAVVFVGFSIGSSYAGLQFIFPNEVRGFGSSLVLLIVNLVGLTVGSGLPGIFTDHLFHDPLRVGDSIALTVAISATIGTIITLFTLKHYRRHYAMMHGDPAVK